MTRQNDFCVHKTPSSNRLETLSQKAFRVFNTPLHFLSLAEASTNEVGITSKPVCVFLFAFYLKGLVLAKVKRVFYFSQRQHIC